MSKEHTISFKVSESEKRDIEHEANIRNMDLSRYLRFRLTSRLIPDVVIYKKDDFPDGICAKTEVKCCDYLRNTKNKEETMISFHYHGC